MRKKIITFILLTGIIIFGAFPLFTSYIPGTADGLAHKFRLVSFKKSLSEGYVRPRWLKDPALGLGSPVFMFNYLLPYYAISGINSAGFDINRSTQIYEAITLFLSGIFMYLLVRRLWGPREGLVAGALYVLAPYHLLTIYLYEGWGEFTSFVYPPLILYLTFSLIDVMNMKKEIHMKFIIIYLSLVLSWLLFILSHNVSVYMFAPFLLFLSMLTVNFGRRGIVFLSAFIWSVFLSAFFWLPAIALNNLTQYPSLISKEIGMRGSYYKSLETLFNNAYTTIKTGKVWYYDFTLGLPIIAVITILLLYIFFVAGKRVFPSAANMIRNGKPDGIKFPKIIPFGGKNLFILSAGLLVFLCIYLANYASNGIWNIKLLHYVVYPFRFLFPVTFFACIISGWLVHKIRKLSYFLIAAALISGWPFLHPAIDIFPFPDSYFQNIQPVNNPPFTKKNMAVIEFLPKWVNLNYLNNRENEYFQNNRLPEKFTVDLNDGLVKDIKIGAESAEGVFEMKNKASVAVNTFYFPNWKAYENGHQIPLSLDSKGLMTFELDKGEHRIKLIFSTTGLEKTANIISIITAAGLAIFIFLLSKKKTGYHIWGKGN